MGHEIKNSEELIQEYRDSIEEYISHKRKEFYEEYGVTFRLRGQVHKIKGSRSVSSQPISMETRTKD